MDFTFPNTHLVSIGRNAALGTLEVDVTRLSPEAARHVWEYGLRKVLNDAVGSRDLLDKDGNTVRKFTNEELYDKARKRLENLYSGALRTRSASGDPFEAECFRQAVVRLELQLEPAMRDIPKTVKPRDRLMWVLNRERAKAGKPDPLTLPGAVAAILAGKEGDAIRRAARDAVKTDGDLLGSLGL